MGHPEDCRPEAYKGQLLESVGIALREYGVSKAARETGYSREGLYRSFSVHGNPRMRTFVEVTKLINFHWCLRAKSGTVAQVKRENGV